MLDTPTNARLQSATEGVHVDIQVVLADTGELLVWFPRSTGLTLRLSLLTDGVQPVARASFFRHGEGPEVACEAPIWQVYEGGDR